MKITAPLLLLPLLLAACGTQSATPAPQSSLFSNGARAAGPTYIEAFEAGVQRDLTALGLSGSISAQATAPKSYLNVLKVSDATARAYMKTTYPAATGCALDWGDGTTAATITTPSVVATDKADHTYAKSGTYTIKLTCGTDVKTSTFAAIVPLKDLNLFDDFVSNRWIPQTRGEVVGVESPFISNGLAFYQGSNGNFIVRGMGQPTGHQALALHCNGSFQTTSGELFDVETMTAGGLFSPSTVTAYGKDNSVIGSTRFANEGFVNGEPVETRILNWKNIKTVKTTCESFGYLGLDDMSFTIQTSPK